MEAQSRLSISGRLAGAPDAVVLLLAGYFAVHFLLRLFLPTSLELDEAQLALLSQWYAPGYDTQPPLYNWVQKAVMDLLGTSVFSLTLLKNLTLFSCYLLYYLTARRILNSRLLAVVAAMGMLTIPEIVWETQRDLSHSNAALFCACLFVFSLFRTLEKPTLAGYILTGLAIGLGLMSKYNFALLVSVAFVGILATPAFRARIFDWRILATAAVALVLILPHALWVVGNLGEASERTLGKLTTGTGQGYLSQVLSGLVAVPAAVLIFSTLTVFCFTLAFRKDLWRAMRAQNDWSRLIERMALTLALIFLALVLFMGITSMRARWLTPILFLLPLYLCLKLDAADIDARSGFRRFLPMVLVVMAIVPAALFLRIAGSGLFGNYPKLSVPYAAFVDAVLKETGGKPGFVIAHDKYLAGNLRMQLPDVPVDARYYGYTPPFEWSKDRPILLAWRQDEDAGDAMPEELAGRVREIAHVDPASIEVKTVDVPYLYHWKGESYRFGYAWLAKAD